MLAHKASHEARVAVEVMSGENVAFAPRAIPAVVFTDPELAWAGLTEALIHHQDIRRPLGRPRPIPPERPRMMAARSAGLAWVAVSDVTA